MFRTSIKVTVGIALLVGWGALGTAPQVRAADDRSEFTSMPPSAILEEAVLSNADDEVADSSPLSRPAAEVAASDIDDANDPLEPVNRWIFAFNEWLYDILFRPIASFYNEYVPAGVRTSVSNFLDNLAAPVTFANNVLQGDHEGAIKTVGRFMTNTIAGIGGLADVAAEAGTPARKEDFGQTLGSYGVEEMVYLVLPIFGPSNPRDMVGKFLVDPYFSPVGHYLDNTNADEAENALTGANGLDEFAGVTDDLEQVKKTSVDYYAAIRSLYRQKRKAEIANGEELDLPPIPDLDLSYDADPEEFEGQLARTEQPTQ